MTVDSDKDIQGLKRAGQVVSQALKEMAAQVKPGITTRALDETGARVIRSHGARSAPQLVYRFPGATCISINNEAAHGIPGERILQPGDMVNLDVSAELDGYFADAALTVAVPPVDQVRHNLIRCARLALQKAIEAARAGQPVNAIGKAIENQAARCGFTTLMDLGGHGVGRTIHEEPHHVSCFYNSSDRRKLTEGMVLTIEPFITTGARNVYTNRRM